MSVPRLMLVFVIGGVIPTAAWAQRPITADSSRYGVVLDSSPGVQAEVLVRLWLARLAQALQAGDTTLVSLHLAPALVPDEEAAAAARVGCRSAGWAVSNLRRLRGRVGGVPLERLQVVARALERGPGATVVAQVRLTDVAARPRQFADFEMTFAREGEALVPSSARGVVAALCGMAVAR